MSSSSLIYDDYLSQGQFGDEKSILFNTQTIYEGLLDIIRYHTGKDLKEYFYNDAPEVAVCTRRIIDKVFMLLSAGRALEATKEIDWLINSFSTTTALTSIQSGKQVLFLGQKNVFINDIIERLNSSFKRDGFAFVNFIVPNFAQQKILEDSFSLLENFLPKTVKSSFAFIKGFAVVETGFESAYNREAPQIFMINSDVIVDPLLTGEFLLHESLHQKMNDLQVTRPIVIDSYDDFISHEQGDIKLPWGIGKPRPFSLVRALATFHVYVHLCVLYKMAILKIHAGENVTAFPETKVWKRFLNSYNRAQYLLQSLRSERLVSYYGREGLEFISWLDNVLISVTSDPLISTIISSKPTDYYE